MRQAAGDDLDDRVGLLARDRLDEPGGDVTGGEGVDEALGRTVALGDDDDPVADGESGTNVGRDLLAVAAVFVDRAGVDDDAVILGIGSERGDGPPRDVALAGNRTQLADLAVRGAAEVDGDGVAVYRVVPRRVEELLAGGEQVVGTGADAFGVAGDDHGRRRQDVEEGLQPVGEDRRQRLHALGVDTVGALEQEVVDLRVLADEVAGAFAHGIGEQQLTAGRCPQAVLGGAQGALVGDGEVAHLVDLVAPELHAQRVLLDGGEHVEQATADGELPALLDHVHARITRGREVADDGVEVGSHALRQPHGFEVGQPDDDGLQQRPNGGDDDPQFAPGFGVHDATQPRQPLADDVRTGRQPLVRQGLPGGELDEGVDRKQARQRRDDVLGLAAGCRDDDDEALGRRFGGDERLQGRGRDDGGVEAATRFAGDPGEGRVPAQRRQHTLQRHVRPFRPNASGGAGIS